MLRPQIVAPTHAYLARMIAIGLCGALAGAAVMVATRALPEPQEPAAPIVITETVTVPMSVPIVMAQEPPPVALTKQLSLVFAASGATYMKLASIGEGRTDEAMPKHGKPKLSEDNYVTSSTAIVDAAAVPSVHRGWLGKTVTVDAGCSAKIVGFAVVARLIGDTGYAGIEGDAAWSATTAFEQGTKVLAAKLDNCAGGMYARDATLSAVIVPEELTDASLVATATKELLASSDTATAQTEWSAAEQTGRWYENEYTEKTAQVLRHPKTGAIWVSVHMYYGGGCGLPTVSVWGLYRASDDGTLTRVTSSLGELTKIEKLVDVDGDGELEVIGRPWLGTERSVQTGTGATVQELVLPYYGCPC